MDTVDRCECLCVWLTLFNVSLTNPMQINRVKSVPYMGMVLGGNLYWHKHVDQNCASLMKYFGILVISNFVSLRILKQNHYAFIHSRILCGMEAHGLYIKDTLSKSRIMQNKLLELSSRWDRRSPTFLVHRRLCILKIAYIYCLSLVICKRLLSL